MTIYSVCPICGRYIEACVCHDEELRPDGLPVSDSEREDR